MSRFLLFFLLAIPVLPTVHAQKLAVSRPLCEYRQDPLGVEAGPVRFSWQLVSKARDVLQTAYRIRVAASPDDLKKGRRLLWDSGRIASAQSHLVAYRGPAPLPRQRSYWQVRVWDNQGNTSDWTAPAWWETGLAPADWQAKWIAAPWPEDKKTSPPSPMLRTTFRLNGPVARARAYVSARGLYEAELNGKPLDDQCFTPGWTSYNRRLQYQTYDVTPLLRTGENALGVMLGDGWYRGNMAWTFQRNVYGDELALLFQLEIEYADGRRQTVVSGPDWQASTGPILASDLYNGETYDARLEKTGWSSPGYTPKSWTPVRVADYPLSNLVAQSGVPVRRIEELRPAAVLTTPKGETVYDFGQNLVGRVRLRVRGPAGSTVILHHAEVLDRDGNFYTANLRSARQELRYTICNAEGDEVYEPHFTFMGFRYVRVQGLKPEELTAVVIHSDMEPSGEFSCSDSLINRLQQNIRWGQRGNFLDVPTDCPQRDERMGWTGDAQAFVRTAAFNYNVAPFFAKWLQDLSADQLPDGRVPYVIPQVMKDRHAGSAGWSDAATIIPWDLFLAYGDTALLARQYPSMKAWVDYMVRSAGDDLLWTEGTHFGDWVFYSVNDDRDGKSAITDKNYIAQAFFIHSTDLLARTAAVLGKNEEARSYREQARRLREAFLAEYVTPNGRIGTGTQTSYVLALAFDLLPDAQRADAARRLADNIRQYGHLTTGFLGTPHLCHVLTRFGHTDLAYQLLERRKYPSWLYPVTRGATTIWERWDGIRPDSTFQEASMNSFNHYAYGAIGDWMYRTVAGLDWDEAQPGYRHILIHPQPGGTLNWARARYHSPYGWVESAWEKKDGKVALKITVPPNTTATVRLAGARLEDMPGGSKNLREEGGMVVFDVGSGEYSLEYTMR
jgi:alpha-L-rhamnosidase